MKTHLSLLPYLLFLAILVAAFLLPVSAQTRGGIETFEAEANARSWGGYSFAEDFFFTPGWNLLSGDDGDVFTIVGPNSGVSLFADARSSGAALVGDFAGKRITGMGCEAFVEDADALVLAEFYFISNGVFHYSIEFPASDFFAEGRWEAINVDLDADPWYLLEGDQFVEVALTESILSSIEEVGVTFYSNAGLTRDMLVALDDFYLVPELIMPVPGVSRSPTEFELTFLRKEGQLYRLMASGELRDWMPVSGEQSITGTTPYTFREAFAGTNFFQIETDFSFTVLPEVSPETTGR